MHSIRVMANKAGNFLKENSSSILMWLGVAGVGVTVYTAHQDTLKAEDVYWEAQKESDEELPYIKTVWKCYIPTAISAVSTIGAIVGSHYCSERQSEALSSAYILSQTTLQEYQRKITEQIGEKKSRDFHEEVMKEVADRQTPVTVYSDGGGDIIDTGHGNTLFYDVPSKTTFKSDMNYIKKVVNDLNYEVRSEMVFDQNEILYRWGLPMLKYGNELVFDVNHPLEPHYIPELTEIGQPRILIDYDLYTRSSL